MNALNISHEVVSIGSTFTIRDLHSNECEMYTLTYPSDADITLNQISSLSPIGKALYGHRVGEIVEIDAPGGAFRVCIEAIEREQDNCNARRITQSTFAA